MLCNFEAGLQRRQVLAALAGAGVLATGLARAQAGWKPPGPVKIVVPFPPGARPTSWRATSARASATAWASR